MYVQCLTSSQTNFKRKIYLVRVLLGSSCFSPNSTEKFENLKQHTRHYKLSFKSGFGQIHQLLPEKSGSENLLANWSD